MGGIFFILLAFLWGVFCRDVPSYVHLCHRNDPEVAQCFVNTIMEIMPSLVKGIPEMDVPPIDPLAFSLINVETGNGRAVDMEFKLLNGTVSGLQNLTLLSHTMDFEHVTFTAKLFLPEIQINAFYEVKGKILLFELNGAGKSNFNASGMTTDGVWQGSVYTKKNKKHISIDTITFSNVQIDGMKVRLHDLFKNSELLTETVNKGINDNILSLKEELQPIIQHTLAEIIRDYFNRVYRLFPMDQLYPID